MMGHVQQLHQFSDQNQNLSFLKTVQYFCVSICLRIICLDNIWFSNKCFLAALKRFCVMVLLSVYSALTEELLSPSLHDAINYSDEYNFILLFINRVVRKTINMIYIYLKTSNKEENFSNTEFN